MESIVWRPQWLSPVAALAYTIGLGNVWRFPYYCHIHGGFVFLVPYCCILLVLVYPLLLLQMLVGQYCGRGCSVIYGNVAPIAAGLGWSLLLLELILSAYYNVQVSWILYYVIGAMTGQPWNYCDNQFNTKDCVSLEMSLKTDFVFNDTSSYATEEYFYYGLLGSNSTAWNGFGSIHGNVMVCLLVSLAIVFVMLSSDIYAANYVITVTVVLPLVLLLLLVSHVLLHRCESGPKHPPDIDWSHVYKWETWKAATVHAFKSLGLTLSGVTSMASHNTLVRNISLDALVIVVMDTVTGILSYVVVSYTLECPAAHDHQLSGDHMLLAFVAYPTAVARISGGVFWALVFFITFLTIGVSCQAMMVLCITISVKDQWPSLWQYSYQVMGITCSLLMLLGLPLCTQDGNKLILLLATATGGPSAFLLCLLAACFLAYGCGFTKLHSIMTETLQLSVPSFFRCYLKVTWLCFTPLLLLILFVYASYSSVSYFMEHSFTDPSVWGDVLINLALLTPFVIYALHRLWKHDRAWRDLFRPTPHFSTNINNRRYPPPAPNGIATHNAVEMNVIANGNNI